MVAICNSYLCKLCISLNLHYLCSEMEHSRFESFFRANYSKAYFLALRLLHDEDAGRDVVADSFEKVWLKAAENEDSIADLDSYLMTTVRNNSLEWLRRQQLHSRYARMEIHQLSKIADDISLTMEREQRQERLSEAMEELTPRTQPIVKACFVDRKKYREVAAELNISESGVKKHIVHALSFLRQKFKNSDL